VNRFNPSELTFARIDTVLAVIAQRRAERSATRCPTGTPRNVVETSEALQIPTSALLACG
jgi:hypothetical protein